MYANYLSLKNQYKLTLSKQRPKLFKIMKILNMNSYKIIRSWSNEYNEYNTIQ